MELVVVAMVVSIILGVYIGKKISRITQKNLCPYCSCRECCSIGYGIPAKCAEEEQRPFICYEIN